MLPLIVKVRHKGGSEVEVNKEEKGEAKSGAGLRVKNLGGVEKQGG